MSTTVYKAEDRGVANHGWLKSHHSFSFAGYFNPERMGFHTLRVINDDEIAGGSGFGTHPHDNMEIISIPLEGALKHKDSMGNETTIETGEVQVMSAGTGVSHSEYNASEDKPAKFLQIWVIPEERNVQPSYSQHRFSEDDRLNQAQLLVSPDGKNNSAQINQQAYLSRLVLEAGKSFEFAPQSSNPQYIMQLNGEVEIADQILGDRDALGIEQPNKITIKANKKSDLLIFEVPPHAN